MDISLARTFLEVVSQGSFGSAAEQLNLTQTAVSARIRALEDQLGRRLFVRNKAGAKLTAAGERFRSDAITLVQVWERARQRVALPAGRANVASIGSELSLWSPLLSDLLIWMRTQCPEIALRAEVGSPSDLLEKVREGSLDIAVLYSPPLQTDLAAELLLEEKLVMVTTAKTEQPVYEDYIHVDWGPSFNNSLQAAFPQLANPAISISLGPLAMAYLLAVGGTGYFRLGVVKQHLTDGRLRLVPDAPAFSYSAQIIYSARSEADLVDRVRTGLRASVS